MIEEEEWNLNIYKKLSFQKQLPLLQEQLSYLKNKYQFWFHFRKEENVIKL